MAVKKYLINGVIEFYPIERRLISKQARQSLVLQTTSALCLEEILKNKGSMVSQEALFIAGWGALAGQTSQASYYQCFVNLRKSFTLLGLDVPVFITVPRRGMIFNEALTLTSEDPDVPGVESTPPEPQIQIADTKTFSIRDKGLLISTGVFLVGALGCWFYSQDLQAFQDYQSVKGQSCELQYRGVDSEAQLYEKLIQDGIVCADNRRIVASYNPHSGKDSYLLCKESETRCSVVLFVRENAS
ncbi:hypothetical protein EGM70_11185 [Enterobacteriaceae bacterium 89]|nr:hypothetical protein [Enterobacteriaceae bacterium 89]